MYQVVKDGIAFHVADEEKAKRYSSEGYTVFEVSEVFVNDDGEFEKVNTSNITGGSATSYIEGPAFG